MEPAGRPAGRVDRLVRPSTMSSSRILILRLLVLLRAAGLCSCLHEHEWHSSLMHDLLVAPTSSELCVTAVRSECSPSIARRRVTVLLCGRVTGVSRELEPRASRPLLQDILPRRGADESMRMNEKKRIGRCMLPFACVVTATRWFGWKRKPFTYGAPSCAVIAHEVVYHPRRTETWGFGRWRGCSGFNRSIRRTDERGTPPPVLSLCRQC